MMRRNKVDRASHAPGRADINRLETTELTYSRSMRRHNAAGITSLPAGKSVPVLAVPLLREDAIRSGRLRFNFEMMETAEVIMNPVNVRVMAYLVPFLAFERFQGSLDILNRSYAGEAPIEGEDPIPFFETHAFGAHGSNAIYKYLGLHGGATDQVNTGYLESYNIIQNFRRAQRSPKLSKRTRLQTTLAEAFWLHEQYKHVVPSYDQSAISGEVSLNVVEANMPLSGSSPVVWKKAVGTPGVPEGKIASFETNASNIGLPRYGMDGGALLGPNATNHQLHADLSAVVAELSANGISVSLANINQAEQVARFAQIRKKYNAHPDWIIDTLMQGISISDQAFKQPMLIGERSTIFGMSKRYATDSGNLDESAVNGATSIDLSIQVPRVPMGGVVMVLIEITPEQLFERQSDPLLYATSVDDLPNAYRDTVDSVKVMAVPNRYVDVLHSDPDATFGYAPNNYMWNITAPRVGGKLLRPTTNTTFDEERQRIWSSETIDPTLAEDFYLCTNPNQKPFALTTGDTFEVSILGSCFIEGNTQFGTPLIEASNDFDKLMEMAPRDIPEQPEEE